MLIGLDFDNTIICYDNIFHAAALEKGLISPDVPPTKNAVRDHLRIIGKEQKWTELQGFVYGVGIEQAQPFPGVMDFLERCKRRGIDMRIISHKTRHPVLGSKYDLREAALQWLETQGFFNTGKTGLAAKHVYFLSTIDKKITAIKNLGCTAFVDDLPSVFTHTNFPSYIHKYLFSPSDEGSFYEGLTVIKGWRELAEIALRRTS